MKKQELKQTIIDQQILVDDLMEQNEFIKSQLEYADYKYFKDTNSQLDWKEFYEDLNEDDEEYEEDECIDDEDEEYEEDTNGISKTTIEELSAYDDEHLDAIIMFIKAIRDN